MMADQATESGPASSVWSTKPEVDLSQLDDKRLTAYRHPAERQALISIAIGVAVLLVAFALIRPNVGEALRWLPGPISRMLVELLHPERAGPLIVTALVLMALIDAVGLMLQRYDLPYGSVEITRVTFPS
jgi:hypothetical protein